MLQVLNMDYKVWAKRFGIRIKEHQCRNCKDTFLATIPVADKGMRGLQIPEHGCPKMYNASHFVVIDKKLENELRQAIFNL